ncbi:hypothetical protein OF83DRAFT_1207201 [Amylostereum chailletii]|nr:hypothetical protein OF83DRAFT_1207201 [Amylostereum chailletii]
MTLPQTSLANLDNMYQHLLGDGHLIPMLGLDFVRERIGKTFARFGPKIHDNQDDNERIILMYLEKTDVMFWSSAGQLFRNLVPNDRDVAREELHVIDYLAEARVVVPQKAFKFYDKAPKRARDVMQNTEFKFPTFFKLPHSDIVGINVREAKNRDSEYTELNKVSIYVPVPKDTVKVYLAIRPESGPVSKLAKLVAGRVYAFFTDVRPFHHHQHTSYTSFSGNKEIEETTSVFGSAFSVAYRHGVLRDPR